jgi:hypothetical protein
MELIKNYLVKISKNEEFDIRNSIPNKTFKESDLVLYEAQGPVNLVVNTKNSEKNKAANFTITNSFSDNKKKTYFKTLLSRNSDKSSSFQVRGNYLLKKRDSMFESQNISTLYISESKSPTRLQDKSPTISRLSMISTDKVNKIPDQMQKIDIKKQKPTEIIQKIHEDQLHLQRIMETLKSKENSNQISTVLKVPISKSPPLFNSKSPNQSQSQLSMISTSKIHINTSLVQDQLQIKQLKPVEQSIQENNSDEDLKTNVHALLETINSNKHLSRYTSSRQNTILKTFDFAELNNELNSKYGSSISSKKETTFINNEKKR